MKKTDLTVSGSFLLDGLHLLNSEQVSTEPKETCNETRNIRQTCIACHIKAFQIQASQKREADFGEPCMICPYNKNCTYDWLSIMAPLLNNSLVTLSLAVAERS